MLLTDLIAEFEFHCTARELSSKTILGYRKQNTYLLRFLVEKHNIVHLEDVRPVHIKQFLVEMQQRGRKPSYINDLLKAFKCMFRYAYEEGYIETLITQKVRNVKEPKVIIRTFSREEIKNMISYYAEHNFLSVRNKVILMLLFDTGVRVSELTHLHPWQIKANSIIIQGKGNKE